MTKWGHRPHWQFEGVLLGSDEHGDWLGFAAGSTMSRPGASYVAPVDQVCLVPAAGDDALRGWVATFHAAHGPLHTYVDMTTPPTWHVVDGGVEVHAVDLDLDVIRGTTGRVWVDDEDEFAQHRIEHAYPEDVCALAIATAERIHAAVTDRVAPFDGSAHAWFDERRSGAVDRT
ncbi:DUF402 domain-containing protein [Nocardioides psychrotolerans]|uniref:DUF402 domain-containing protein n=1 Tax=Nocardioides psychrotolerans TaxID=1005945 RepID=A0A1I3H8U0_9ACTN|nr:DUF402 domain-containing protein [Nocardioides psychrotolerans]SFI32145.1 hypothetical protein SAMN05216561_10781 [Nocardioides psychrotolerans]